jgi:predicted GNAT family N-acyltransferase
LSAGGVRVGDWATLGPEARRVRLAVFVEEQGIAPELELDARDAGATHAVVADATGRPIGTGRLLPDAHIGRMAVLAEFRGQGVGRRILRALVAVARERGIPELRLHAQMTAVDFYAGEGFEAIGEEYEEAGIPHRTMRRVLDTANP